MAFLPIQADNRSQRVRIGGKTILPFITSYVDEGFITPLQAPTFTNSEVGKKASGKGLKKEVYFAYGVTAVDAAGSETPIYIAAQKTGAGAEAESELNFVKVKFVPVDHAVSYNIYRSGVGKTGYATEAEALAATLKKIANVPASEATGFTAEYQDANSLATEEGTTSPTGGTGLVANKTYYNTGGTAWSTRHELQNHLTLGAVVVVGPLTLAGTDLVPVLESWSWTLESEKIKVAELKTGLLRSTGQIVKIATVSPTAKKTAAGKERLTLFVYNRLLNTVESIEGAEETEKEANLGNVEAKLKTYQEVVLVVKTTNSITTPAIVSGRGNLLRVYV